MTAGLARPIVSGTHARRGGEGPAGDDRRRAAGRRAAPHQGRAARGRGDHRARARRRRRCGAACPRTWSPRAREFLRGPGISVVPEARLGLRAGARARHARPDRGRRGHRLLGAGRGGRRWGCDWTASGSRCCREGRVLCEAFGLDPLGTIASGALLLAVAPADARRVERRAAAARASTVRPIGAVDGAAAGRDPRRGRARAAAAHVPPGRDHQTLRRRAGMIQIGYAHRQAPMARRGMVAACHPARHAGRRGGAEGGRQRRRRRHRHQRGARRHPAELLRRGRRLLLPLPRGGHGARALPQRGGPLGLARRRSTSSAAAGCPRCPWSGPGSVSVPGRDAGLARAARALRHAPARARCSSRRSTTPAEGFPAHRHREPGHPRVAPELSDDPEWRRVFVPGGAFPQTGDCFRQPDLARTLTELRGRSRPLLPRARGAGRSRAAWSATASSPPAISAAHAGEWGEPISTTYRGYTVYETPPPTQGLAALLTLNLLEGFDARALRVHSRRASAPAARDDQARLRRSRPLDRRSRRTRGCRWSALLTRSTRRRAARRSTRARRRRMPGADPDGDTTGFVVADGQGQRAERHPEPLQGVRLGRGRRPAPAWCCRIAAPTSTPIPPIRTCFAPRKRPFHTLIAVWSRGTAPRCWATPTWAATGRRCSTSRCSPTCSTTAWRSRRRSSGRASCSAGSCPATPPT